MYGKQASITGMKSSNIVRFRLVLFMALLIVTFLMTAPVEGSATGKMNDKLGHVLVFYMLALLADFSFPGTGFDACKTLTLTSYALLVEVLQYVLPYRTFSLLDLAADGIGLLAYLATVPWLRHVPFFQSRWAPEF